MSKELVILLLSWVTAIVLLIWKVPREKRKEAQVVFLFAQTVGWLYLFIQTYHGNIVFPFREFPQASDMLVTLHYIIYPTFSVFFVLFYPKTTRNWKIVSYYLIFVFFHQFYEMLLEHYTKLIDYRHMNFLWGFIVKIIVYFTIYRFYKWFAKGLIPEKGAAKI